MSRTRMSLWAAASLALVLLGCAARPNEPTRPRQEFALPGSAYSLRTEAPGISIDLRLRRTAPSPSGEATLGVDLRVDPSSSRTVKASGSFVVWEILTANGDAVPMSTQPEPSAPPRPLGRPAGKTEAVTWIESRFERLPPEATAIRLTIHAGETAFQALRGTVIAVPLATVPVVRKVEPEYMHSSTF